MKPSWKDAPEWAQWLAMDEDGEWYCYEERPCIGRSGAEWDASGRFVGCFPDPDGWRDTLEQRPAQPAPCKPERGIIPDSDDVLAVFAHRLLNSQESMPPEVAQAIQDGFWDLFSTEPNHAQPATEMPSLDELIEVAYMAAMRSISHKDCVHTERVLNKLKAVKEAQG